MSPMPDSPIPDTAEQTALACYLRTVVAMGNCMAEVCPSVGAMYRDRLLKLPRRLGFDATPQALLQSREAVETDLLEYARTASAWTSAGSNHAAQLLDHLRETEDELVASADLQNAFLDDLAEHIATAAEVDEEAQLRVSFKRYAAGLSAYARRAKTEKLAAIENLRRRREEIEAWLADATASSFVDPGTGLLNRAAAEMRIETEISRKHPFCVIVVGWREEGASTIPEVWRKIASSQIMKEMGERLSATVRPYDIIFRWSENELVTIFESTASDIPMRVQLISGWLGDGNCSVEIDGVTSVVRTHTTISVVEHRSGERAGHMIGRVEAESRQEVGVR
jgi:GGDEF domain-containing protein